MNEDQSYPVFIHLIDWLFELIPRSANLRAIDIEGEYARDRWLDVDVEAIVQLQAVILGRNNSLK
jgi:hypothetical protein